MAWADAGGCWFASEVGRLAPDSVLDNGAGLKVAPSALGCEINDVTSPMTKACEPLLLLIC